MVLELDAAGLEAAQRARDAQRRAESGGRYDTALELLASGRGASGLYRLVADGALGAHVRALEQLLLHDALQGAPDGVAAVLAAAEAVGAEVVPADREQRVTRARMDVAQLRAESAHSVNINVLKDLGPPVAAAVRASFDGAWQRHGCQMRVADIVSASRVLIAEAAALGRARPVNETMERMLPLHVVAGAALALRTATKVMETGSARPLRNAALALGALAAVPVAAAALVERAAVALFRADNDLRQLERLRRDLRAKDDAAPRQAPMQAASAAE